MPCDTIQLNTIEIGKMNRALLEAALKGLKATNIRVLGNGVASFYLEGQSCRIEGGRLTVREGYEHIADRVKVAYSRQVLGFQAKRNGWQVKEVRPNVFQVIK